MKVTTKTRFGYAWTSTVSRCPVTGGAMIRQPTKPEATNLGWRQLKAARAHAARLNSGGTYWSETVFVGGRPVAGVHVHEAASSLINALECDGYAEIELGG